jgi:hypothetical protein
MQPLLEKFMPNKLLLPTACKKPFISELLNEDTKL